MAIRVLLADDHAVVREGLRLILEAGGGIEVVEEAADGREALEAVRRLRPDVVIVDLAMPGLNGIEATRQIVQAHSDTHVLVLSMYGDAEHIHRALSAGATGYLLKESAGREVAEAVRVTALGRRYLSRRIEDTVFADYIQRRESPPDKTPLESLTPREREVLQLVVEGKSSKEIARTMDLSPKTVETYRSRMGKKLGISDVPSLVRFAIEHGLTGLS